MASVASIEAVLGLNTAPFNAGAAQAQAAMQKLSASIEANSRFAANALNSIQVTMERATVGIETSTKKVESSLQNLISTAKGVAGVFGVALGIREAARGFYDLNIAVAKAGDTYTQLGAKLEQAGFGADGLEQAQASAQKLGLSVETVAKAMARLGRTLDDTDLGEDQIITFTETLAKMARISSSTASEVNSGLTQLSQGLAKGRLDGDELKAVLESIPEIGPLIAKQMGVAQGALRDLGAEGKITTEVITAAVNSGAAEINRQFNALPENLEQSSARMKNEIQALMAAWDEAAGNSSFIKLLQGGIADLARETAEQIERAGIPGALFGTLAPTTDVVEGLQQQIRDFEEQRRNVPAGQFRAATIEAIDQQILELTGHLSEATLGMDRLENKAAARLRSEGLLGPGPIIPKARPVLPTAAYEQFEKDREDAAKDALRLSEHAGAAANRELEARRKIVQTHKEALAAAQSEAAVAGKGEYEQALAKIEVDRQKRITEIHDQNLKFTATELKAALDAIDKIAAAEREAASKSVPVPSEASATQRQAEKESFDKYVGEYLPAKVKADVDASKEAAKQAARAQADIYAQPFKDLATNVSRTLSDGIQDALSGDFDFDTFADSFTEIFTDTLAASITTVIQPSLTKAANDFGGAIQRAMGTPGAPAAEGGVGGTGIGYGGYALAGAAAGGTIGALYGQYGPGTKPGNQAALGGAIGGAAGALAGAYIGTVIFPGVGTLAGAAIGATVGGTAGAVGGSFIGGENNLGNDRSAQQFRRGRGITYADVSFSQENRTITQGIIDQVIILETGLERMGGAIEDFGLRIEAGNKTGITVNGKKFPDAQAALSFSIEKLIGGTTGLSATQTTILATSKGKDVQQIVADLEFGEAFDQLTFSGTELERQLQALNKEMVAFGVRAVELDLDVNAVAAAHQREADELIAAETARINGIRAAIEGLAPSGNQLELAFNQLNDRVQELARAAVAAGIPLDGLVAAHQRAADAIIAAQRQLEANLRIQVAAIDPATNPVQLALDQLNSQVMSTAAQLTAAGLPIDELQAAHARAADKIIADARAAEQAQADASRAAAQGQREQEASQRQADADRRQADADRRREEAEARREDARQQALTNRSTWAEVMRLASGAGSTLQADLLDLQTRFIGLREAAKEAGIPMKLVNEALKVQTQLLIKAEREMQRAFTQEIELLEAGELTIALAGVDDRFRGLIERSKDLGWATGYLVEAQERARQKTIDQAREQERALGRQITTQVRGIQTFFKDLIEPLRAVNQNVAGALNPAAQVDAARGRLRLLGAQAAGGDVEAIRSLSGAASELDQLRREFYGTGGMGAQIAREISGAIDPVISDLERQQMETLADLPAVQRETTAEIVAVLREELGKLQADQRELLQKLKRHRAA